MIALFTLSALIVNGQDNYLAAYSSNTPSIDGQVNSSEWSNANNYNVTFTRNDGNGTKSATLYLQHDNTWLYVGVKTTINSGWDVYLQLRFDGNNDHTLSGNTSQPHTDVQIERASPGAWSGYTGYYCINGTNTTSVTAPAGTEWESYSNSNVNYEYKIKLSDLNSGTGQTIGFFMLNGTDGTSQHGYEFPTNGVKDIPSDWAHIVILNNNVPQYEATYSSNNPTIDGQVNTSEWSNANSYNVTFIRNDGGDDKTATMYLQHDNSWLFVGIKSTINSGWDVYLQLRIDGNNDHLLSGNSYQPHTDIQIEHASPGGWSGYTGYYFINGTNTTSVSAPSGTEWESYGSTNVNYEYKISLSDLNTSAGQTIGFFILNGTDGTSQNGYELPINGVKDYPSSWCHVLLQNTIGIETPVTNEHNIQIFPNPISDQLNIELEKLMDVNIEITNSIGKRVYFETLNNHSRSINTSGLTTGVYLITIRDTKGNILFSKKIVKE